MGDVEVAMLNKDIVDVPISPPIDHGKENANLHSDTAEKHDRDDDLDRNETKRVCVSPKSKVDGSQTDPETQKLEEPETEPQHPELETKPEEPQETHDTKRETTPDQQNIIPQSNPQTPLQTNGTEPEISQIHVPEHLQPSADSESPQALPKHQLKYALGAIRAVKRLKDAIPFNSPVDPVKLNIPTYHDFVKTPMDLSTIDQKLVNGEYKTVAELSADFDLMLNNCFLFNGSNSPISLMGKKIRASFEKHISYFPSWDGTAGPAKPKKTSTTSPTSTNSTNTPRRAAAVAATAANAGVDRKESFALQPSGLPMIRRDSAPDGRPKREIHPPKPKDLPYGDVKPRKKKFLAELKFCGQVLKELFNKKHEAYSFPFLQPVDPVALNCPTYFKVVKEPMDLSTIQEKYNNNQYESGAEFEKDIRLMFNNCYKFNPSSSPVNVMGRRLEAVFEKKWMEKPVPEPSPPPMSHADVDSEVDDDDLDEFADVTNPAIKFLEAQLDRMMADLAKMKEKARRDALAAKKGRRRSKVKGNSVAGGGPRRKSSVPRGSHSQATEQPVHVTYEMKKELSDTITQLPEKKLRHVLSIIQESMPDLRNSGQEEIELDIDQLDPSTVLKLYKFAVRKDEKRRDKPSDLGKPVKRKSKPLSEAEQSRQIEEIQKKIRQFDRANGGAEDDVDDDNSDESSDEEEDLNNSDSSSEED